MVGNFTILYFTQLLMRKIIMSVFKGLLLDRMQIKGLLGGDGEAILPGNGGW